MADLVRTALLHGLALSAAMTLLVVASLRQDPAIWTRSAPKDVQAFLGPPSVATRRRRVGWGVVLLVVLVGVFGHLTHAVGDHGVGAVYLASWLAFQLFNLYDAVVIDLGLVLLKPRWAFVPGTADLPGLRDPRWHLGAYGKGFVGGFVFAGLVAGISWVAGAVG